MLLYAKNILVIIYCISVYFFFVSKFTIFNYTVKKKIEGVIYFIVVSKERELTFKLQLLRILNGRDLVMEVFKNISVIFNVDFNEFRFKIHDCSVKIIQRLRQKLMLFQLNLIC